MIADDLKFADSIIRPHAPEAEHKPARTDHVADFFANNNHWKEYPAYPLCDWQHEVAEGSTRLGYVDWCLCRADAEDTSADAA